MSNQAQKNFNLQFVKDVMKQWTTAAQVYEREAEKAYTKLRSYLTLYQFRLPDSQKHEIREMLSESLDNIEKMDMLEDMDSYLDGFCFKLDPSVLPKASKPNPTSVKIEISPEETPQIKPMPVSTQPHVEQHVQKPMQLVPDEDQEMFQTFEPVNFTESAVDLTDFYQMQFLQ